MNKNIRYTIFSFLRTPLLLVLLLLAAWFALTRTGITGTIASWFKKKPLLIDNTPLVITEVKNIAELQTATLYAELVVDSTVFTNMDITNSALRTIGMPALPASVQRKIVLIVKGKVIAGIDLKQLTEDRFYVKEDSVSIRLPGAKILEVITNPSDFETFIENGQWTDAEVRAVKNKAQRLLLQKATEARLIQKGNEQSIEAVEQMMRSFGFNSIHIYSE